MRTEGFKGALLSTLIVLSMTTPALLILTTSTPLVEARILSVVRDGYIYSTCSLVMLVDNENLVAHGGPNAYNTNAPGGEAVNPGVWYDPGDLPPIIAATEAGSGRVVACAGAGMLAYDRPFEHDTKDLILNIFDWLDPTDVKTIVWYEGREMYYDTNRCSTTVEILENENYTVDTTTELTAAALENYKILVLNNQVVSDYTAAERAAIENWVENQGGGLFLGCQSDYGSWQREDWMNPILVDLDANFRFQDDQVVDDVEWIENPFVPRMYLTDHPLNKIPPYGVSVKISPGYRDGLPGSSVTFTVTLTNIGAIDDNYILEVTDELGWTSTQKLSDNKPFVGRDPVSVTLDVDIPANVAYRVSNTITVRAESEDNENAYDSESCFAYSATWLMPPEDDATVVEKYPDRVYGGTGYSYVGSSTTEYKNERIYLKFDLSQGLPAGYAIQSARLYLFCFRVLGAVGENVVVRELENDVWKEENIAWNTRPEPGPVIDIETITADYRWYSWDVTSWAENQRGEDNIMSLCVMAENESQVAPDNFSYGFDMKEYDEIALHPYLAIEYRVETYVTPWYQEGLPCGTLKYEVEVTNRGARVDNYDVTVVDTAGWVMPGALVASFENVQPSETRRFMLEVKIPSGVGLCENDNILVIVTSQGNENMTDNYKFIAHAAKRIRPPREDSTTKAGMGLENTRWGRSETIWVGRYLEGPERGWLKFDLQAIPSLDNIVRARLYLFAYQIENGGAVIQVHRVDNDNWLENEINWTNQPPIGEVLDIRDVSAENRWYSWDVTDFVREQFLLDNLASFCLVDLGENIAPDHVAEFSAKEYGKEVNWAYLETLALDQLPDREVRVYVDPVYQGGLVGDNLVYTVTVVNKGTLDDNYTLTLDNVWPAALENTWLWVDNGENATTTLTATVPDVPVCTMDNLTVTATSQMDPSKSDNFRCFAHRGRADLSFLTLYKVEVDMVFFLSEGSPDRLSVRFYTYPPKSLEAENIFWTGTTPTYLEDVWEVGHSLGVKVADLVWTDDAGNVIRILDSIMVTKDDLFARIVEILGYWPEATPAERDQLFAEIVGILGQWPEAP